MSSLQASEQPAPSPALSLARFLPLALTGFGLALLAGSLSLLQLWWGNDRAGPGGGAVVRPPEPGPLGLRVWEPLRARYIISATSGLRRWAVPQATVGSGVVVVVPPVGEGVLGVAHGQEPVL